MSNSTISVQTLFDGTGILYKGKKCFQTEADLLNYRHVISRYQPKVILEVGRGEGGTLELLKELGPLIISLEVGDYVSGLEDAFVVIDSDVHNFDLILEQLAIYTRQAKWLVVCHTLSEDFGSQKALNDWMKCSPMKNFQKVYPPFPSRHTWMERR